MRIDVHGHAQPPEFVAALLRSARYEIARDPAGRLVLTFGGARLVTLPGEKPTIAERIEALDALGIDLQLLSLSTPQVYFLQGQAAVDLAVTANDFLAGMVRDHPTRFRALASLPLTAGSDAALRELERCVDDLHMPGVLIGANIDGRPLDDPAFEPVWAELDRRGLPIFVHPMVPAGVEAMQPYALAPIVGFMFDTTLALARLILSGFFERYPRITVIAGHLGAAIPYLAGRLDLGWRSYPDCRDLPRSPTEYIARLHMDSISHHAPALRCAIDTVGHQHILFGTDYPFLTGDIAAAIGEIERLPLSPEARDGILGANAARLFGIA